jgi:thiol:disulfide interchange protein DsbC
MHFFRVWLLVCIALFSNMLFAVESDIKKKMLRVLPQLQIAAVEESEIKGLYRVTSVNDQIIFTDKDAQYFLSGELFGLQKNQLVNITEQRRQAGRAEKVAAISESDRLTFPASGERKATIFVFTDIDCGYCRKLHDEVPRMNELGIEVNYLAYPRAGVGSASYNKIVSAWCAEDRRQAMTDAKAGKSIPPKKCANPVAAQFEMGGQMGVTGTPAIVLEDGTLVPGYVPADKLAEGLGIL